MPSEVIRCSDCGAIFKGVPAWLAGAKVKFTCTNCPKRPSRLARFEPPPAPVVSLAADPDVELDAVEINDIEGDADLDLAADDLDDLKDEKDV